MKELTDLSIYQIGFENKCLFIFFDFLTSTKFDYTQIKKEIETNLTIFKSKRYYKIVIKYLPYYQLYNLIDHDYKINNK